MKKILLAMIVGLTWMQAADNDLYDHAIGLYAGYGGTGDDSGAVYGLRIDQNLHTQEGIFNLDAVQFALDYAKLDGLERDYAVRIGGNVLWFSETDEAWMPFVKMGLGVQFFGGDGDNDLGDHFYGTLGGGIEYQMRPDTSVVGEIVDHLAFSGENTLRASVGLKYSFGQGY